MSYSTYSTQRRPQPAVERGGPRKQVLLLVLDGIRPDVMRSAIRDGDAPAFASLVERGEARWDAVSVFPSITPAATSAIGTGEPPSGSGIIGHAWYDRDADEMVVYGAKTGTVIKTGAVKVFHNHVWRMNRDDLIPPTIFEELHDRGIDGSCVNFPVRRGPYEHPVRSKVVEGYIKGSRYLGASVAGPREYYFGDLFRSRELGLNGRKGNGGLHRSFGINDDYAAEVGTRLLAQGETPFTLVYLFRGDQIAHHEGIAAQRRHLARMDEQVSRMVEAAGGMDRLLEEYVVISVSDHGHAPLLPKGRYVDLRRIPGLRSSFGSRARMGPDTEAVVVPNGRAASLYLREPRRAEEVGDRLLGKRGVDFVVWKSAGWVHVKRIGQAMRFRPGNTCFDGYGDGWEVEGDPGALDIVDDGDTLRYGDYPDALNRLWGCPVSGRAGDLVLSAAPGYTFGEVHGGYHEASDHGSLHREDSEVFSIACGVPAPRRITEVTPAILAHFDGEGPASGNPNRLERSVTGKR